uniref:Immunoglobulin V-set domain-containing protein n=1 Tax=Oryzias latipes TaxID=8090 RepID=A0A3B3HJM7_ORYLA
MLWLGSVDEEDSDDHSCLWTPGNKVEKLTAVKKEESTLEGTSVALSYKYKNSATGNDYFFWYRQFPGKPPEFLISHSGTGTPISQPVPGFSFKVSDDQRQMDLQISSAAVTDSAVYYCAVWSTVTGNNKTLGRGSPPALCSTFSQ